MTLTEANRCDRCGEAISTNNNEEVMAEIREFTGGVCMTCHRLAAQEDREEGCDEDAPF